MAENTIFKSNAENRIAKAIYQAQGILTEEEVENLVDRIYNPEVGIKEDNKIKPENLDKKSAKKQTKIKK